MSQLFITLFNMSLTAAYVATAVMIIRLFLKKMPKIFSYVLWIVVLFRMVCPFSFESVVSLLPINSEPIPRDIVYMQTPEINSGLTFIDTAVNSVMPSAQEMASVNPVRIILFVASYIWLAVIIFIFGYAVATYVRTKLCIRTATLIRDNVYETDRITTPFVIGFIKPKIYLPVNLTEKETEYIIHHEQTHIKRRDHIIKVIAFAALTAHWFNPVLWISYFLMAKDMELSCDESVLKHSEYDIRVTYSNSLLSLSVKQSGLPNPLSFGENNVKTRVKNVLKYKKPAVWITIMSVIVVIIAAVMLACNQAQEITEPITTQETLSGNISETVVEVDTPPYYSWEMAMHNLLIEFPTILDETALFEAANGITQPIDAEGIYVPLRYRFQDLDSDNIPEVIIRFGPPASEFSYDKIYKFYDDSYELIGDGKLYSFYLNPEGRLVTSTRVGYMIDSIHFVEMQNRQLILSDYIDSNGSDNYNGFKYNNLTDAMNEPMSAEDIDSSLQPLGEIDCSDIVNTARITVYS